MTPALLLALLSVAACAGWSWTWSRQRTVTRVAPGEVAPQDTDRRVGGRSIESALVVAATAMRSGASLQAAWEEHAGIATDTEQLPLTEPLIDVATEQGIPDASARIYARNIRAACRLAARTGAPLADVLDDIRAALDDLELARTERMAAMAGPRMTVRVLLGMPVIGVLFGMALGVDPLAVFTDGGLGTACLVIAAGLCFAGWAWSNRLIRGAESAGGAHA